MTATPKYPYRKRHQGTHQFDHIDVDNIYIREDCEILGNLTFGNAAIDTLILKGRVATGTAAGSNITIDATYINTYQELQELRCRVTNWGTQSGFNAYYMRAENYVAGSGKALKTVQLYGADYGYGVGDFEVIQADMLLKSGVATYGYAAVAEFAFSPESGTGAITITNHAETLRLCPSGVAGRIDASNAAKIHGIYLLARDGDGGSTKLGDGFYMGNDTSQSGTRTLTNGINIAIGCTTGVKISGACSGDAINISGTQAGGIDMSGTYSDHMIYLHPTSMATGKRALRIGDYGSEVAMAAGEGIIRSYAKITSGTDSTALAFHWGFTTSTGELIGEQMQMESHAATPGPVSVIVADFIAGIDSLHYIAASVLPYDGLKGGRFKVYAPADAVCNGNVTALWLDHQMSCAVGGIESSILVTTGGTVPDAVIRLQTNSSGVANLLYFDSLAAPLSTSATALAGITTSHKLAVYLTGVGTVYIPVVTTGMA